MHSFLIVKTALLVGKLITCFVTNHHGKIEFNPLEEELVGYNQTMLALNSLPQRHNGSHASIGSVGESANNSTLVYLQE